MKNKKKSNMENVLLERIKFLEKIVKTLTQTNERLQAELNEEKYRPKYPLPGETIKVEVTHKKEGNCPAGGDHEYPQTWASTSSYIPCNKCGQYNYIGGGISSISTGYIQSSNDMNGVAIHDPNEYTTFDDGKTDQFVSLPEHFNNM